MHEFLKFQNKIILLSFVSNYNGAITTSQHRDQCFKGALYVPNNHIPISFSFQEDGQQASNYYVWPVRRISACKAFKRSFSDVMARIDSCLCVGRGSMETSHQIHLGPCVRLDKSGSNAGISL